MKDNISARPLTPDHIPQRSANEANQHNSVHSLQDVNVINVLYVGTRDDITNILNSATTDNEARLDVATATTIEEAYGVISKQVIECIISDYNFSDRTGIEFLHSLREENIEIPFILHPTDGNEKIASKAISAGVTEYIHEGTNTKQWNTIVEQIVTTVEEYRSQLSSKKNSSQLPVLFERSPIGIIQWDKNLQIDRINSRATDILRESEEELQDTSLETIISSNIITNEKKNVQQLSSTDQFELNFSITSQPNRPNSQYRWHHHVITNESGNIMSAISYLHQRHRGEQPAKSTKYKTIIESLSDAVYVLDEEGLFTYINDEFVDLVGYSRDRIIGSPPSLIKNKEDVKSGKNHLRDVLSSNGSETVTFEITLQRADGTTILCEDHMGVLPYDGETFEGSVGVLRDITDQRKHEKLFEAFVEETNDVISVIDSEGTVQYMGPSVKHVLGYSPDTIIGENIWDYIHPDDREEVKSTFSSFISSTTDNLDNIEYRARHTNGSWKWMEMNGSDQSNCPAVNGYIINSRDISARKEREQQLQLFDRVLRHNLRNDLNVIRGSADTIKAKSGAETAWLASKITETSNKLLDTAHKQRKIMQLLRKKPNPVQINLGSAVQEIVTDMEENYPQSTINIDCPNDTFVTVSKQFSSIIREAIQNSIIHDNSEPSEVNVSVVEEDEQTCVRISDNGPPIAKMDRMILSDTEDQTPLYHGSGLGLWLIKSIVDRSGGTVSFIKPSAQGNTLEIKLLK